VSALSTDSLADVKRAERAAARRRRADAFGASTGLSRRASGHLLDAIGAIRHVSVVSAYLAMRDELDPRPAMLALHTLGYRLCVPVTEALGTPLRFRAWTPDAALVAGPFGTSVPGDGDWLVPEVLVVPLLAFDRRGHRLGYGGGYYDRTIAALRAEGRPVHAIGYAFAAQEVEAVPVEATDAALDAVVTELGVLLPA
jgi:5-formyltetrahydrofolate cyclo-ligase